MGKLRYRTNGRAGNVNGMHWLYDPTRALIVYVRGKGVCSHCGEDLSTLPKGQVCVDHLVPRSQGGSNALENLLGSCMSCNLKRGTKTLEQFHTHNGVIDEARLAKIAITISTPITKEMRKEAVRIAEYITGRCYSSASRKARSLEGSTTNGN